MRKRETKQSQSVTKTTKQPPAGTFGLYTATLDRIIHLMKIGSLDKVMEEQIRKLDLMLDRSRHEIRKSSMARYYQGLCVIAEYYDYRGDYEKSLDFVNDGEAVFRDLQKLLHRPRPLTREDRELYREQIRYVANYAMAKYYRSHEYEEAEKIVKCCLELVLNKVRDEEAFPSAGTMAQLTYFLGRINRQNHNHQESMQNFDTAIWWLQRRGEIKKKQYAEERIKQIEEWDFIRHRTAHCLSLGLGWVCYTRGQLRQALHFIQPAQVLLLHANDPINVAYTNLIYAATRRALGETDTETIKRLSDACSTFEKMNHRFYHVRATYELMLAYIAVGDKEEAESTLKKIDTLLRQTPDTWWECNALIVRSRIERDMKMDFAGAEKSACTALEKAEAKQLTLCRIDALIARGEARIKQEEFSSARDDLERASWLNRQTSLTRNDDGPSPKIEAACNLHVALSYALEGKGRQAKEYFQKWEMLKGEVEHHFIKQLAQRVKQAIQTLEKDFLIPASSDDLNYESWNEKLKAFLVRQAKFRKPEKEQQRELLGVTRPTYLNWEKIRDKE